MTRDDQGTAITKVLFASHPGDPARDKAHERYEEEDAAIPRCDCGPGWKHDPTCPEVTG